MTTEDRLSRLESNVGRLAKVQDETMDLLGLSLEGERRLATRMERIEESHQALQLVVREIGDKVNEIGDKLHEVGDKLNGLIGVVNGMIHGRPPAGA